MFAIHDQFTHQMSDRLQTICMGLGLVRLLQDAKRFDEDRATLCSLENGFQEASDKPGRQGVTRTASCSSGSGIVPASMRTQPLSIA